MNKKTKIFGKIFAVTLALIIALTTMSTAFAAKLVTVSGSRGTKSMGLRWAKEITYNYKDAQGKSYSLHCIGHGGHFAVHFFARKNQTLNFKDYTQRAYCIQPALDTEYESHGNDYYYNGTIQSGGGVYAYDKALTTNQKSLLNMVLANGYGTLVPADKTRAPYWYATQLLVYETVMGIRSPIDFEPTVSESKYPLLSPGKCLETDPTVEAAARDGATPAQVQAAYTNMVDWVKRTLASPKGTTKKLEKAPTYNMIFDATDTNNAAYRYYLTFNDIITNDFGTYNGLKDDTPLNIRGNDVKVENSPVNMNVSIDYKNKRIVFSCKNPMPKGSTATIKIIHPRRRGLNEILAKNPVENYGRYGLMLIPAPSFGSQTYAAGAAQITPSESYFKLRTAGSSHLKLVKVSANPELTDNNSCYSKIGAKYGIYWTEKDAENDTNRKGVIVVKDEEGNGEYSNSLGTSIPARDYWAKEIEASPGFGLDPEVHKFEDTGEVDSDGASIYSFTSVEIPESDPVNIFLKKYNVVTGQSEKRDDLGGAVFEVKFYDGQYNSWDEVKDLTALRTWYFTTREDGTTAYNPTCLLNNSDFSSDDLYTDSGRPSLPFGSLSVREVKAPEGYFINEDIKVMPVDKFTQFDYDNNPINPILFDETPKSGGITIQKKSDDGVVKDIYFEIKKESDDTVVGVYSTNATGIITVEDLDEGTYIVTELGFKTGEDGLGNPIYEIPARYTPKQNPQTVTVVAGEDNGAVVEFENNTPRGEITINKQSGDGVVKGIYFKVTNNNGYSNTYSTNSAGTITVKNLPVYDTNDNYITYTISEIGVRVGTGYKFPDRYYRVPDQTVVFDNGTSSSIRTASVTFVNTPITGNIQITKSDADGSVAGVGFRVKSLSPSYSYDKVFVTNSNGVCSISNLPVYDTNDVKIQYQVSEVGRWNEATQQYKLEGYYFQPEDQVFTLKNTEKANDAGEPNYQYDGNTILVAFENVKKKFNLDIIKDADDGVIENVWFNVSASDGSYNKDLATNNEGKISIKDLLPVDAENNSITYTVKELGFKLGDGSYKLSNRYYKVESQSVNGVEFVAASADGERKTATVSFQNESKFGYLKVIKRAEDGKVEGIWFKLTDSEGNTYGDKCTDANGVIEYEGLPVYNNSDEKIEYTITELGVQQGGSYVLPFRYEIIGNQTTTLNDTELDEAPVVEIVFENILKKGSATIKKVDENNEPLDGAIIALYKADGTLIGSKETPADGTVKFENLDQGDYYFEETKAPAGRTLLKGKVEFSITGDSEETLNYDKTVSNNFNFNLPNTGANGILYLCIGGAVILAAGIVIILYLKKKKK